MLNSYHSYSETYAPLNASWGELYSTTKALEISTGSGKSLRIELRLAGDYANLYLLMSVLLPGIHHGLENHPEQPTETKSDAYFQSVRSLPET